MIQWTARWARRLAIGIIGLVVLATGLVLLVTPGPAIVVIPAGLAILSLEFAWARRLLRLLRVRLSLNGAESSEEQTTEQRGSGVEKKNGDPGRTSIIR